MINAIIYFLNMLIFLVLNTTYIYYIYITYNIV